MVQTQLIDLQLERSSFIDDYVREHQQELDELRAQANAASFEGTWVVIGDERYLEKRLQYATTSFPEEYISPRIIFSPTGVKDIQKAIQLCNNLGMKIAVRTGGHQYCGYSSTAPQNMQIDLSAVFQEYDYDQSENVLKCGVNHALGDWAALNNDHGIYLPMGVCSNVHLGGHVHTGGWGMVARSHGLLADHVLAFDIILASGEQKHVVRPEPGVTDPDNDDIYFAVLGGSKGGEFGLVTHWEFSPLRNADYPKSACYSFIWFWSRDKMERIVSRLAELSKLCADGTVPSDYEFMLTITGFGKVAIFSDLAKDGLRELGVLGKGSKDALSDAAKEELRALGMLGSESMDLLPLPVKEELSELAVSGAEKLEMLPEHIKDDLRELGIIQDGIPLPPMIQMWMCYTNKEGDAGEFDDQWFESFANSEYGGPPCWATRLPNHPVSDGLANHFIMKWDREMEYPFVKRFRATKNLPDGFPQLFTDRMYEIMGRIGTRDGQHLVSQQQIYAGGAVAANGAAGITAYSWRDQAQALSHDSFYSKKSFFHPNARARAEQWQSDNDVAFIQNQGFADQDMRMFAYTFGDRDLENVWQYYYDSPQKYERLKKIKGKLDPTGLFSADQFSLKPS